MVKSCWRSESFWRLILEPPKSAKVELWFEPELNFRICRWHVLFTFFLAKYQQFSATRIEYGGVVRTCCIKKASHRLALSFVIFDFCATRIEYGGVRAARDAAHSTSSAYSDGGRPQKKSMGKSKKCALTVKQFSVTTWPLTSGEKKTFFLVFCGKMSFFTPSNPNANRFSWKNDQKVLRFIDL